MVCHAAQVGARLDVYARAVTESAPGVFYQTGIYRRFDEPAS
jgi:hypothetical protein